jgi:hypothetical protein
MNVEGSGISLIVVIPVREKLLLGFTVMVSHPNEISGPARWMLGSNSSVLCAPNVSVPPPTRFAVIVELVVALPGLPGVRDPWNETNPVRLGSPASLMDAE